MSFPRETSLMARAARIWVVDEKRSAPSATYLIWDSSMNLIRPRRSDTGGGAGAEIKGEAAAGSGMVTLPECNFQRRNGS